MTGASEAATTPCRLPLGLLAGSRRASAASTSPGPGRPGVLREASASEPPGGAGDAGTSGPSVRYQYTPPDDSEAGPDRPGGRCRRCPRLQYLRCLRCPPSPCVTRTLAVMQECADGLGAWPSGRCLSSVLCPLLLLLMLWALSYCLLGDAANVDGPLFRLTAMFVAAKVAGWMTHRLADVPALVGMLVVGVAMKSTGYLEDLPGDYETLIARLRKVALSLIMLRSGLGLDPVALRSLSLLVLGLAVVPALVEVTAVVGMAYWLLDLPPLWGVLLGLVLAAVAPSVVMPCFAELRAQGLGVDKGIDTLVVAAASFDDVIAISLYGLVQSLIFDGGTSAQELVQHPLGLVFGILYGTVVGKALQLIPTEDARHASLWRFVLVLCAGLMVTFGSDCLGYHEAGSVGSIATAFVAAAGWRARETILAVEAVESYFCMAWSFFEPIMFSLIGADINTAVLDGDMVGFAVGCIFVSLMFRTVATWLLLVADKRFNWKERLFVALAWLPKADVQAALGPLALDAARHALTRQGLHRHGADVVDAEVRAPDTVVDVEDVSRGGTVLLVAVLSILLTAPAGSVVIASLSRRLLVTPPTPTPTLTPSPDPESGGGGAVAVIREVR